jgi:hypothetical protein
MARYLPALRRVVTNPFANIAVGLILLVTSLMEAWETLFDDIGSGDLGAHHGLMIFAVFQILKTLPDLMDALHFIHRAHDDEHH